MAAHAQAVRPPLAGLSRSVAAGLVLGVAAVALSLTLGDGERTALRRMTSDERGALYDRSLEAARSLCARAKTDRALRQRCEASTQFLLAFPECDDGCHAFVRQSTRR